MPRLHLDRPVEQNFLRVYPALLRKHFRRGRRLAEQHAGEEELHRYRIRTKRLRYITELYAELYPELLRPVLAELRGIQGVLGQLQDQRNVIAYFERRLFHVRTPARQAEYLRMRHRAQTRMDRYRQMFFRRWARLEGMAFERKLAAKLESAAPRRGT
jgi:CHAD domain-containing protein